MSTTTRLEISFTPGDTIKGAYEEAIRLATLLDVCIEFNFNNVKCLAFKNGDARKGEESYHRELKSKERFKIASC